MPRTKSTEGVKWRIVGMRDAGMKQADIPMALNVSQTAVSRLLKKHRETGSVKESKRSTLILECKGPLLKRNGRGCISYDHMLQFEVVNGTLNSQKYRDEILESDIRPSLNSPECQNTVIQDDNAAPQRARITEEYNK